MLPSQSSTDNGVIQLEEFLQLSAEVGVEGAVLFGVLLFVYFVAGVIVVTTTRAPTPYPFLSVETDPVLLIDSTIVGVFTVQAAGSQLLYHLSAGVDDESLSSVVLSFLALGVGGALLQMSLPEAVAILLG
jgi:hypothetical protein